MTDTDLTELRKQCVTSLYLCSENVSKYLDSEKEERFDKLKSYVTAYCVLEAQEEVAIHALEKTRRETDTSNVDTLQDRFTSNLASLAGKRLNVDRHPYMVEFHKRKEKSLQLARQNLDESDLAITEAQDQYIDPITKTAITDPVKNSICGHIYEKETILNLINVKNRLRCPVAGCGNREFIQKKHLISDEELKFRMAVTQHSTMIQERSILNLDCTE